MSGLLRALGPAPSIRAHAVPSHSQVSPRYPAAPNPPKTTRRLRSVSYAAATEYAAGGEAAIGGPPPPPLGVVGEADAPQAIAAANAKKVRRDMTTPTRVGAQCQRRVSGKLEGHCGDFRHARPSNSHVSSNNAPPARGAPP